MSAIAGIYSPKKTFIGDLENSLNAQQSRGGAAPQICDIGFARLGYIRNKTEGIQPLVKECNGKTLAIVLSGELYNANNLLQILEKLGHQFVLKTDSEIVLHAYAQWGSDALKKIEGVFAFAIADDDTMFLARDPMGIMPLFYHLDNRGILAFASQIRGVLAFSHVTTVMNEEGFLELIAIGPARTPGCTPFRDVKELKGGHYMLVHNQCVEIQQYWSPTYRTHRESYQDTVEHVRMLLNQAIEKQSISKSGCLLSGGLDSSILTAALAKHNGTEPLTTYSIDFFENDKYFQSNAFQPESDGYYAMLMSTSNHTQHSRIEIGIEEMAQALIPSMRMRDLPGMADVDSSLYLLLKEISNQEDCVFSGECADEVFAGYPWFYRENLQGYPFPWTRELNYRASFLPEKIREKIDLQGYIEKLHSKFSAQLGNEKEEHYILICENLSYFGATLLDRTERTAAHAGITVRMPFADPKLVEYVLPIPKEMKFSGGRPKGLLRDAMGYMLPVEVAERKKSPFPKTYHPKYTALMREALQGILQDSDAPIFSILSREALFALENGDTTKPWFGQLMAGPQLMAYMVQLNAWLKEYNVIFNL